MIILQLEKCKHIQVNEVLRSYCRSCLQSSCVSVEAIILKYVWRTEGWFWKKQRYERWRMTKKVQAYTIVRDTLITCLIFRCREKRLSVLRSVDSMLWILPIPVLKL